mmetsp:Transcript_4717/g.7156  ORF Transcript_4717/g.7156 Transcript_4717/m.7156 type:complete len:81 (-) Transcript_4717:1939-2181(-)
MCFVRSELPMVASPIFLINLDRRKDLANKPQGYERSNRSTNQKDSKAHQKHVSKVEQISEEHLTRFERFEPKDTVKEEEE